MTGEERERQNTIDIRSYDGSIEDEFKKIINYLEFELKNMADIRADSVIEPAIRKLVSMRLKHTSEKLDVLSRRVLHTT